MEDFNKDYILLDGILMKEEQLLKLARNAGNMMVAEHYLCAYLMHALLIGKRDAIEKVNAIRVVYGAPALYGQALCQGWQTGSTAEMARKKYVRMAVEDRNALLSASLKTLMELHANLFTSRTGWMAIFLVLKDRIDGKLKKSYFADWMRTITPKGWPQQLMISDSTLSNFSHYVSDDDRDEAYYDMEDNPWEELCNTFWDIMQYEILTCE